MSEGKFSGFEPNVVKHSEVVAESDNKQNLLEGLKGPLVEGMTVFTTEELDILDKMVFNGFNIPTSGVENIEDGDEVKSLLADMKVLVSMSFGDEQKKLAKKIAKSLVG